MVSSADTAFYNPSDRHYVKSQFAREPEYQRTRGNSHMRTGLLIPMLRQLEMAATFWRPNDFPLEPIRFSTL
ncbi:hypothetical protein DESC_740072 [Desulfosarcina cetonica]|nr:hypothetical protein DESC_740072 [Desulfosarcina cetonica]